MLFAVLLIGASFLIGQLTAGQDVKIIKDLGLAATSVFGLFIAIFIGIGLVSKEVERRSIYSLLAKPVTPAEFILGKYAGPGADAAASNVAVMTVALYARARLSWRCGRAGGDPGGVGRAGARSGAAEGDRADLHGAVLVTAVALFFSTFSSPMLSAAFTFGVYVAGQFNADLKNFDQIVKSRRRPGCRAGCYYVLPDFAAFDVKTQVVHGLPVSGRLHRVDGAATASPTSPRCSSALDVIFSRRDFK